VRRKTARSIAATATAWR